MKKTIHKILLIISFLAIITAIMLVFHRISAGNYGIMLADEILTLVLLLAACFFHGRLTAQNKACEELADIENEIANADSIRDCFVNEVPATLYTKGGRAYLCWTVAPEYSFVIEYTPEAVREEEIFRMAEDLQLP